MSLTESIVEDAALTWFGELGYAVGHGPHLAPGGPAAEREPERSARPSGG
jgi:type I restriction enzyme, R subunit